MSFPLGGAPVPRPVNLRLHNVLIAGRADAVAELDFRVPADVALNPVPVVLLITNVLTVRADGEQSL